MNKLPFYLKILAWLGLYPKSKHTKPSEAVHSCEHVTKIAFAQFDLLDPLTRATSALGFKFATPIQAAVLPKLLRGENVIGQAKTGTGKTAAFLLATLQYLLTHKSSKKLKGPRALILAPTRELAIQIFQDAKGLGQFTPLKFAAVYGGMDYGKQKAQFDQMPDCIIGTPGRIIDFYKQRLIHFKAIQVLVFDEADRMFDLGFIKDMRFILRRLPPPHQRLNLLFSATMTYRVRELAYEHMDNPECVIIESDKIVADRVEERMYCPANEEKLPLLMGLLASITPRREIIFVNTKQAASRVCRYLNANGFHAAALSGDIPQRQRIKLLDDFTKHALPILVATDVAARGLHIPEVFHVFNYDIPDSPKDYVHRIGRTARAGAKGIAISFACEKYAHNLTDLYEYLGYQITTSNISNELLFEVKAPKAMPAKQKKHSSRHHPSYKHQQGKHRPRQRPSREHKE